MKETILSEENNWKTSLKLDKYNQNGQLIKYEIDEKEIPTGYSKQINENIITNKINNYKYKVEYYFDGIKKKNLQKYMKIYITK